MTKQRDLNERERTVIRALGAGESYKEIAAALGISTSSVNTYRQRAYRKLGVGNIVDAVLRLRGLSKAA